MIYDQMKEKIQKIHTAVSRFGILVGPKMNGENEIGLDFTPGLDMLSDAKTFEMTADDIKKGIFKVLVMGEFKTGKSTAINAIVGKNTVPTKTTACTAIITILIYGSKTNLASVYMKDNPIPVEMSLTNFFEKYKISNADIDLIEEQGFIDRFADVEYAIIESDHPIFENGVRVIDSPGLGEAVSRTKTTLNFVSSANAIVFLLNATHLFSKEEKEYIKQNFVNKQLKNIFFIVNRINQINDSLDDIKPTVESNLKSIFADSHGKFDKALYEKRVFYVDAYGAYIAKGKGNIEELNKTGMPIFEKELEKFLTSEDRVAATFQSTLTSMANTFKNALVIVDNNKSAIKAPLEDLELNHEASLKVLKELEGQIREMEKTFTTTSILVQTKVYQSLMNYISVEMPKMWDDDLEKNEVKFGVGEMLKLAWSSVTTFDKEKRAVKQEQIIKPLAVSIQKYIADKLDDWGKTTDILISPEIDNLRDELSEQVEQFSLGFSKASQIFAGNLDANLSGGKAANVFQLGLSLIQGDASVLIENAAGGNFSWGEWIKKYVVQAVMQIIIFSVFTGGVGFIVWLIAEIFQLTKGAGKMKDKLLQGMSGNLFAGLKASIKSNESCIKKGIDDKFKQQFNIISSKSRELISEEEARQKKIMQDKNDEQFNVEEECTRMDRIIIKLFEHMDTVYFEVFHKKLTQTEIDRIAKVNKPHK